ncbi:MAG TPA: hypothetical protein DEA08_22750, partial [Planctomycetes bacterium]|nr:hypothetical protein [Planctomycetota bacterium]
EGPTTESEPEGPTTEPESESELEGPATEGPTTESEPEGPTTESELESPTTESEAEGAPPSRGLRSWWVRRREQIESKWSRVGSEINRTRLIAKVFLLHVRYVFGYLAFGFAVSAPLQLGRLHQQGWEEGIFKSLLLGGMCGIPFLLLWPLTIIAWERMRIPEFKNLELGLTRWAAIVAALWVFSCGVVRWPLRLDGFVAWIADPQIAWITFGLMFFAWLRVKFHTMIFREFYTLKHDEDLVLRVPPSRLDLAKGDERGERD